MDLALLAFLDVLVEERSVTAAAKRLGITQSAASQRLAKLRQHLEDPVVVQKGRKLVPTARVEQIAPELRKTLGALRVLVRAKPAFDPGRDERTFRFASSDIGQFVGLLGMMDVARRHLAPSLRFRALTVPSDPFGALERGDLDLILGVPDMPLPGSLRRQRMYQHDFVVVGRAGHPALRGGPLSLDAYCRAEHIVTMPVGDSVNPVETALAAIGRERTVTARVSHFLVAAHIASSTDLLMTAPRLVGMLAERLALSVHSPPFEIPPATLFMLWHEHSDSDPAHAWMRERVIEVTSATKGDVEEPLAPPRSRARRARA
jgi:DNA-binding transcriptional LysR family regulator